MVTPALQAAMEMRDDGSGPLYGAPTEFICVPLKAGMSAELLWRLSWALNVIGHNVVELSDYDWLVAIRRQRMEM